MLSFKSSIKNKADLALSKKWQPAHAFGERETSCDKETILFLTHAFLETFDVPSLRRNLEPLLKKYNTAPLTHRLPKTFDAVRLQEDLERLEQKIWNDQSGLFEYHEGSWKTVNLRSPFGDPQLDFTKYHHSIYTDTETLKQAPYFQEVLSFFKCPTYRVRLSKMKAGSEIVPHVDTNTLRFHVPIVTHEDVLFYLHGDRIFMKEGELWYLDTSYRHSVKNESSIDRVHLLIDVAYTDWARELFPKDIPFELITTQQYKNGMNIRGIYHLLDIKTPPVAASIIKENFNNLL